MGAGRTMALWLGWALLAPACLDASPGEADAGADDVADGDDLLLPWDMPLASSRAATFVTWNLKTFPLRATTPHTVATWLERWQDDVIAVQEITDVDAFATMLAAMPDYAGVLNDDPGAWMRVGLIYNTQRVVVDNVETLFVGDSWAFPRPPLKADVRIDLPDLGPIDFTVIVVHLKSQLGSGTQARRHEAAVALQAWVAQHAGKDADRDVVILGDFNEEVVAPPAASAFGPFLTRPDDYAFLTYDLNAGAGYSQLSFQSFLDHILVTSDALSEYGSGATTVIDLRERVSGYQEEISDHLPVRAVFVPELDRAPARTH